MLAQRVSTAGATGVLFSFLASTGILPLPLGDAELPLMAEVDVDTGLLAAWRSEDLFDTAEDSGGVPFHGECEFFNFTRQSNTEFCEPFAVTRVQTSLTTTATDRALRCAAKHDVECVLSIEVGYAVPAAFVLDAKAPTGVRERVAPRIVSEETPGDDEPLHVRVANPEDSLATRVVRFHKRVTVDFMTANKQMKRETFEDAAAFCVQLLRVSYAPRCWSKLDGK